MKAVLAEAKKVFCCSFEVIIDFSMSRLDDIFLFGKEEISINFLPLRRDIDKEERVIDEPNDCCRVIARSHLF